MPPPLAPTLAPAWCLPWLGLLASLVSHPSQPHCLLASHCFLLPTMCPRLPPQQQRASPLQPPQQPHLLHWTVAKRRKRKEKKREKDLSATTARIKDLHVGFDFSFKFPILGNSNPKTRLIYWIWLHLLIPLVELLQLCCRSIPKVWIEMVMD